MSKHKVRTLFLSDLHIFSPKCNTKELLQLLSSIEFEKLYLVGDIFDFTFCRRFGIDSDFNHLKLLAKLINIFNDPSIHVTFVLGNHESNFLKEFQYWNSNNIVVKDSVYTSPKGEHYLVQHGHQEVKPTRSNNKSKLYLKEKFFLNLVKLPFGKQISKLFKMKSLLTHKKFYSWVANFENGLLEELAVLNEIQPLGVYFSGIICGHSHSPCRYLKDGKEFINLGDFVHNNSYLVETLDGELKLKSWNDTSLLRYTPYAQSD